VNAWDILLAPQKDTLDNLRTLYDLFPLNGAYLIFNLLGALSIYVCMSVVSPLCCCCCTSLIFNLLGALSIYVCMSVVSPLCCCCCCTSLIFILLGALSIYVCMSVVSPLCCCCTSLCCKNRLNEIGSPGQLLYYCTDRKKETLD
jgi:hypothetical protein